MRTVHLNTNLNRMLPASSEFTNLYFIPEKEALNSTLC